MASSWTVSGATAPVRTAAILAASAVAHPKLAPRPIGSITATPAKPKTLLRWKKLPEFERAYREARMAAFRQSTARLQQASSPAVTTLLKMKRLETVRMVGESNQRMKIEFAYLKLLPREYSGLRHIVSVSKRLDGRCEYEERPGPPPPNHAEKQDPNVRRVYLVRAQESGKEIGCATN